MATSECTRKILSLRISALIQWITAFGILTSPAIKGTCKRQSRSRVALIMVTFSSILDVEGNRGLCSLPVTSIPSLNVLCDLKIYDKAAFSHVDLNISSIFHSFNCQATLSAHSCSTLLCIFVRDNRSKMYLLLLL